MDVGVHIRQHPGRLGWLRRGARIAALSGADTRPPTAGDLLAPIMRGLANRRSTAATLNRGEQKSSEMKLARCYHRLNCPPKLTGP